MNYRRAYIENSKIFITIVTNKRRPILIDNIDLLRDSFRRTKEKIKFEINAIVILPDHLHMIIQPKEIKKYPVRRLGFNPTSRIWDIEAKLEKVA